MEPNRPPRGVSLVSSIDPLISNARLAGTRPFQIRRDDGRSERTAPDRPVAPLIDTSASPDFHSFYVVARPTVGRALVLTLRDPDLAADAVDEAMVRAFQRWDRVGVMENPAGWVYRVGLNHARSRLRRLLRRPPQRVEHGELSVADPSIAAALDQLSVDHRAVVVCRHLLGWSEADTAAALGIRPGTVKSRLSRALTQLESTLHHLRPEDPR